MDTIERLAALLPPKTAATLKMNRCALSEVRLRAGRPVQLVFGAADRLCDEVISADALRMTLAALMDYSLHAHERELAQGYFTMEDGSRVGVCGRIAPGDAAGVMTDIGSVCVRIAREVPGCADGLMPVIVSEGSIHSILIASAPGMGKTTMLRDVARQLSLTGRRVAVADERHELAACRQGVPTIDLGPRTDVMDGGAKHISIGLLLRAMAPDVIVTDEIGGPKDAEAIADAARCGAAVIVSAHASGMDALMRRPGLFAVFETGVFEYAALLGSPPGTIAEIRRLTGMNGGRPRWECA